MPPSIEHSMTPSRSGQYGILATLITAFFIVGWLIHSRTAEHRPLTVVPPYVQLAQAFSAFRGQPEPFPASLQGRLTDMADKSIDNSASFKEAQYVHSAAGGLWLVPSRHIVCAIQVASETTACTSSKSFLLHGMVVGTFDPPEQSRRHPHNFAVMGIAPKWARSVRIRIGQGRARKIGLSAKTGTYAARAPRPIHVLALSRTPANTGR